jgi:hypothetical protein
LKWVALGQTFGVFRKNITRADIENRKNYYLESLMEDIVPNNMKKEICMDIYKIKSFYDDLTLTSLGRSFASLSNNGYIDLIIISNTIDEHFECKKTFLNKKVEF